MSCGIGRSLTHLYEMAGKYGSTLIADTTEYTGDYVAIQVVVACTFTTLDDATRDGTTLTSGITFPAGFVIYGTITKIELATGTVIAIKGDS